MLNGKNNFINFKVHTHYSICEGAISINDLAQHCKINKIPAIGISDSYNLCGALEFSEAISKARTQPIIGTQINFKYKEIIGKVPIFARTNIGYNYLVNLSSKSCFLISAIKPILIPLWVSLKSALSDLRLSLYSALDVNIL